MIKDGSAFWRPDKRYSFLQEIQEGSGNISEARDEGMMVTQDPKCGLHFFNQF